MSHPLAISLSLSFEGIYEDKDEGKITFEDDVRKEKMMLKAEDQ